VDIGARTGEYLMARVRYLEPGDLAASDRDVLARPITLAKALAHSPDMARRLGALAMYLRNDSPLDARLRELGLLQIGWLSRCAYEYSHHLKIGYEAGVTDADLDAMADETRGESSGLPELDRAVLRAARSMHAGGEIDDATWTILESRMPIAACIDLVVVLGFYCGVVRTLSALRIEVEPEYQRYLAARPFPEDGRS